MSWQLAALALLGLTLAGGAVWYERSRPPSQLLALVAALAALAVAGRVALSPIPNVVPTTDIAILAGYSLGGAPGFAVGAFSGLISNFWLGQGPWTPWQMAGWGLCGVGGAALAVLTRRRAGRLGLACFCGLAGFAFGALMDLSLMVTYGGEQSLDRFLALSARGLPFNIAHAAGNVALALAAGPAIARMLSRYRERFEFAWPGRAQPSRPVAPRGAVAGLGCLLALAIGVGFLASGQQASGASGGSPQAVAWLRGVQNPDGGFGPNPGDDSDPAMTGWVALGLESAGINPLDFGSPDPIAYLRSEASGIRTTGDIERTILVLAGAGLDSRDFGGSDLVARLRARRGRDGSLAGQVNLTAFSIMALEAAGERAGNGRSAAWLARARNPGGGWGLAPGAGSEADSTGAAMQGLAAVGRGRAARRGAGFLRSVQRPNGGFRLYSGSVNSQSTAWATQGLVAAGADPSRVRAHGRSPLDYLAGVQAADGHYRYSASSDQTPVWVTAQALTAVDRRAFPIAAVARAPAAAKAASGASAPGGAPAKKHSAGSIAAGHSAPNAPAPGQAPPEESGPFAQAASRAPGEEDDGGDPVRYLAAGSLALAAAVWGGWLIYRRRLP